MPATAVPCETLLTEDVIRRHQRGVWRYLRFLGAPPVLADDLVQEAFLALLRKPPTATTDAAVSRWLRRTAANLFRNTGRQPRPGVTLEEAEAEVTWSAFASHDDGDAAHEALSACVDALPDRMRRAVDLRYAPGGSRRDVAATLGISDEGAKTLLRRARARLGECVRRKTEGSDS